MQNNISVHISSKLAVYDFVLHRRVTLVQGESGKGKTLLRDLVAASSRTPEIKISSTVPLIVPPESKTGDVTAWLKSLPECVIIVDEDSIWINSTEFYDAALNCNIWLLVVTRKIDSIKASYSVQEIYELHSSGKFKTFRKRYEFELNKFNFDRVITEDRASGKKLFEKIGFTVKSSNGNSGIVGTVLGETGSSLVVLDGANYGRYYSQLLPLLNERIQALIPESIEEFMLKSTVSMKDEVVRRAVESPEEYKANDYKTWEIYYTTVMDIFYHRACGKKYDKGSLPRCLVDSCCFKGEDCTYADYRVSDKIFDMFKNNEVEWILEVKHE